MNNGILLGGIIAVAFMCLYAYFNLQKSEGYSIDSALLFFYKLILFSAFLFCIVLIGKVALDEQRGCQVLVSNVTTSGATDTLQYSEVCFADDSSSSTSFWDLVNWLFRLTVIFFILSVLYGTLKWLWNFAKSKRWI